MIFDKYYIVANTREEFENESITSRHSYNDHPSTKSINYITSELICAGFNADFFGGTEKLIEACYHQRKFQNTLFLNFSDGMGQISRKAQSAILLELLGVPYAGSDPLSRLMAGNKAYAKRIVSEKIDVPQSITQYTQSPFPTGIRYPVVIKPNREGSSIGITQESHCANERELKERLPRLTARFPEVLVEEYIPGYEITCFIIGNKGSYYLTEPIICEYEGVQYFENFVFGLEEKASRVRKEHLARNILNSSQIEMICHSAQTAFEMLNMHDFARADFRLRKDNRLFFIELNGNAVISETSEVGVISRETGIPFGEIVGNIIHTATNRLNSSNHD